MSDAKALPELLKPAEAAELMRTTVKAMYLKVERRQIPESVICRDGARLLFRRDALRAHLGLASQEEAS